MGTKKIVIFGAATAAVAAVAFVLSKKAIKKEEPTTSNEEIKKSCDVCKFREGSKNGNLCGSCSLNKNYSCKFMPHPVLESIKGCKVKED